MSHELSVQNGRAEMFSGNNMVPWHKMGEVVAGLLTAKEAIEAAHLGWKVVPQPVTVNGKVLPFPTEKSSTGAYQGICREDTGDCLGIMRGNRYEPIQNTDCFDFMDNLVGDGGLRYETAGALRGGQKVWMMAQYNGGFELNGDEHKQWLLLVSSHDGSTPLMVQWVTERVVCANTLSVALRGAKNQIRIRHTSKWSEKVTQAKRVLGLTVDYFAEMRTALAGLNMMPLTPDQMGDFARLLLPVTDEKNVPTRTQSVRNEIVSLFDKGAGNRGASRWDALQAVTDYADHGQTLRGATSRLESALLGSGAELKQRAFDLLTSEDIMADLLNRKHVASAVAPAVSTDFARLMGN